MEEGKAEAQGQRMSEAGVKREDRKNAEKKIQWEEKNAKFKHLVVTYTNRQIN